MAAEGPVLTDGRRTVPVPPDVADAVAWVMERDGFADRDLEAAFPALAEPARRRLLRDLAAMRVIEPG